MAVRRIDCECSSAVHVRQGVETKPQVAINVFGWFLVWTWFLFFFGGFSVPPPPPRRPSGQVGERCSPQGPVSSEVTKVQQTHRELRSLECSWGREVLKEVLRTPQDLPSTVCSTTCDPLGQPRSATGHMPRAPLWGSVMGWRKPQVTRPTDSPSSLRVGLPCPAAGARSTGHTHPPPTHANRRTAAQRRQKVCNCALTQCPEPPTGLEARATYTQARRYLPLTSALVGFGDRQQSGGCETRQPG